MMMKRRSAVGLTLIEILIVTSLVSVLSLAIYRSLITGINVWQRSQQTVFDESVVIFFEKLNRDLRNWTMISTIEYVGEQQELAFPTKVDLLADPKGHHPQDQVINQIGKVRYRYDALNQQLIREEAYYGQAVNDEYLPEEVVLENVEEFRFSYLYPQEFKDDVKTRISEWPPAYLEVELFIADEQQSRRFAKIYEIPLFSL